MPKPALPPRCHSVDAREATLADAFAAGRGKEREAGWLRILVVEDDERTADGDRGRPWPTTAAIRVEPQRSPAATAFPVKAIGQTYAAIILDRMLPGDVSGLSLLAALRAAGVQTPVVLILSALSAVDERVRGLKAGGDDYLTKPFEEFPRSSRRDWTC